MASHGTPPKVRIVFERAAVPDDSRNARRGYAAIIDGTPVETRTTLTDIVTALHLDPAQDSDGQGGYLFNGGTVRLTLAPSPARPEEWKLHIVATRGDAPVITGLTYLAAEGREGPFVLTGGFVTHRNATLDNQHINNPDMHAFVLEAAMKEIRRIRDPEWWHRQLVAYDREHGTGYAEAFLASRNGRAPDAPHA